MCKFSQIVGFFQIPIGRIVLVRFHLTSVLLFSPILRLNNVCLQKLRKNILKNAKPQAGEAAGWCSFDPKGRPCGSQEFMPVHVQVTSMHPQPHAKLSTTAMLLVRFTPVLCGCFLLQLSRLALCADEDFPILRFLRRFKTPCSLEQGSQQRLSLTSNLG